MNIQINKFSIADYDEVYALWQRSSGVSLSDNDSRENIAKYLRKNEGLCFVARAGKTLVGAVLCGHTTATGFIHHLAVTQKYRRKGIGKMLVERCLDALREFDVEKCQIVVAPENLGGQRFWDALGWQRLDSHILMTDLAMVANPHVKTVWEQKTSAASEA